MVEAVAKQQPKPTHQARLKGLYNANYRSELKEQLSLKNVNEVPKLEKVVINVGLGKAKDEKRLIEVATNTIEKITGQKPIQTTAKKSIASFKLREGSKIGLKLTLRDGRMYEFVDRLINIVIPRLRDFHGVSPKSFDKDGNYNLGLVDQSVFPELSFEDTATAHGIQVVFVINSKNSEHSRALLEKFGLPFEKNNTPSEETNG